MLTWAKMVRDYLKCQKGQGMVEYGLILAVIAAIALASFTTIGQGLVTRMANVVTALQ